GLPVRPLLKRPTVEKPVLKGQITLTSNLLGLRNSALRDTTRRNENARRAHSRCRLHYERRTMKPVDVSTSIV
ncbi:MAG: hypothetical protein ACSLFE_09895, partial [Gemmatimonadaceae bacterium]